MGHPTTLHGAIIAIAQEIAARYDGDKNVMTDDEGADLTQPDPEGEPIAEHDGEHMNSADFGEC